MSETARGEQLRMQSRSLGVPTTPESTNEFAAYAVHEFRGPIHTLQAFLSILLREQTGPLSEIQRDFLTSMLLVTHRLERLTEDIGVVLVDGKQFPISRQYVNVTSLIEDCRRELAPVAEGYNVDIEVLYETDLNNEIESDAVRLAQITINLLENAIRHAVEGSTVRIRVRQSNTRLLLVLENESINSPEADIDAWFVPFVRGTSAHERAPHGLGLGLPIVSHLVAALGGQIMTRMIGPVVTIAVCLPQIRPADVHE